MAAISGRPGAPSGSAKGGSSRRTTVLKATPASLFVSEFERGLMVNLNKNGQSPPIEIAPK